MADLELKKIWSVYNPKTGIYCVLYSLKSLLDHAMYLFMRIPILIIGYLDLSLLNLQGKSKAFLCGGGDVYFHKKWARVIEIYMGEVALKASDENEAPKNQEMAGEKEYIGQRTCKLCRTLNLRRGV